jgi:hypothetical protein
MTNHCSLVPAPSPSSHAQYVQDHLDSPEERLRNIATLKEICVKLDAEETLVEVRVSSQVSPDLPQLVTPPLNKHVDVFDLLSPFRLVLSFV